MGFQNVFGHRQKIGFAEISGPPVPVYGPYTIAFSAVVVSRGGVITNAEKTRLTTFETSLGTDITEFDRLWIHGLSNNIAALTSFVNPLSTIITAVNSPTFTPNFGYTGNFATMYLNTNYNLTTNSVKFTLNNASAFMYIRTNSAFDSADMGAVTTAPLALTQLLPRGSLNNIVGDINGNNNLGTTSTDSRGFFSTLRTGVSANQIYKNGAIIVSGAILSRLPNSTLFLLCRNLNGVPNLFSGRQISLSGVGSSNINQLNFYNAVQTLGTSLGWAV